MPWVVVGASVQPTVVLQQKIDVVKDIAVPLNPTLFLFSLKKIIIAEKAEFVYWI